MKDESARLKFEILNFKSPSSLLLRRVKMLSFVSSGLMRLFVSMQRDYDSREKRYT
jgi:hypothetical protein